MSKIMQKFKSLAFFSIYIRISICEWVSHWTRIVLAKMDYTLKKICRKNIFTLDYGIFLNIRNHQVEKFFPNAYLINTVK